MSHALTCDHVIKAPSVDRLSNVLAIVVIDFFSAIYICDCCRIT